MPRTPPHILIAGAGIGGLTAAAALAHMGAKVDVFEQAKELHEVGAGLQQSANAMHVHKALGIAEAVIARGAAPQNAVLRRCDSGKPLLTVPLGDAHTDRYGAPYIHIHRADLQDILKTAAINAGVNIHLGKSVTGYSQNADSITLLCGAQTMTGDALIGADGIKSTLAAIINPDAQSPQFTGQTAWRGMVPSSALPLNLISADANAWLGGGAHIVAYYVRGGDFINFVAVQERKTWTDEGWNAPGEVNNLRRAFAGWDPRVTALLDACSETHLRGLFDRAPLPRWTDGRAALLGDACHPMLPFMAQGAACAIEDGYVLAAQVIKSHMDIPAALKRYESLRKPRATKIQNRSSKNAAMFHHDPGLLRTLRDIKFKIAQHIPAVQHSQFDWLYGYDANKG